MQLPKAYNPQDYESDIYELWERSQAFKPESGHNSTGQSYSVVMPPPNANGNLHIGHGLTFALEDIAARYHRLKGDATLLLPGADHAGFETQVVYEKVLERQGKSRFDFSREELYEQIWDFVELNKQNFESQLRRLGVSCDWSRFVYTLDEKVVKQTYVSFKKMWEEGLIYRGERLVNYCTKHRTGFADIEVDYKDQSTPLYYLKYGPFTLATTRPETKFGDTAVAVHPDDKRFKEYVGKIITVEGVNGPFQVEVVADEMVDREFGTGVVKITPAHDFNDWEVAQRHNLPVKKVINLDGTMNEMAGPYSGMTVLEARKAVVKALEEKGLLEKIDESYQNRVGHCYKCGTVIEPMLLKQWFVDMKPLAEPAIKALKDKQISFYPDSKRLQLINYLEALRDWNISRQIAWGIPIPAFQNIDDLDDWIYDDQVDQKIIEKDGKTYRRDTDVFDTWFSSSSWPYSTLDYPKGKDFKQFYPLSLMETGGEILYPWVSRMIMLGLFVTGEIPFKSVYIHGYVMATDGAKMSKSLGNVINPLEVVEEYGSDALRMGIVSGRSAAINSGYDISRIDSAKNFANKIWNIARYSENILGETFNPKVKGQPKTDVDHWMMSRLQQCIKNISFNLESYRFAEAYDNLYHLVWDDFADWYIEASKVSPNPQMLGYTLASILKLAHPFAPFLTETVWQTLNPDNADSLLINQHWPSSESFDKAKAESFAEIKKIVTEIRSVRKLLNLSQTHLYHTGVKFLDDNSKIISTLSGIESVKEVEDGQGLELINSKHRCWLDVDQTVAKAYLVEIEAKLAEQSKAITGLQSRLENKSYIKNAPKEIVSQTKAQLKEATLQLQKLETEKARFARFGS